MIKKRGKWGHTVYIIGKPVPVMFRLVKYVASDESRKFRKVNYGIDSVLVHIYIIWTAKHSSLVLVLKYSTISPDVLPVINYFLSPRSDRCHLHFQVSSRPEKLRVDVVEKRCGKSSATLAEWWVLPCR